MSICQSEGVSFSSVRVPTRFLSFVFPFIFSLFLPFSIPANPFLPLSVYFKCKKNAFGEYNYCVCWGMRIAYQYTSYSPTQKPGINGYMVFVSHEVYSPGCDHYTEQTPQYERMQWRCQKYFFKGGGRKCRLGKKRYRE